jgi:hypothetical protein
MIIYKIVDSLIAIQNRDISREPNLNKGFHITFALNNNNGTIL